MSKQARQLCALITPMFQHLHGAAALCTAFPKVFGNALSGAADFPSPLWLLSMLAAGLAGSVAHCGPMCGPFVLGQVAERLGTIKPHALCECARMRSALLVPYHAGRLLTYATLGALVASFGAALVHLGPLPAILLLCAGGFCFLKGVRKIVPARTVVRSSPQASGALPRLIRKAASRIDRSTRLGGFLLGMLLGFLPCGLLYGALTAAAATANPLAGAATMLAFGAGTIPALVAIGFAGYAARRLGTSWWLQKLRGRLGGTILLVNASFLWILAARMLVAGA